MTSLMAVPQAANTKITKYSVVRDDSLSHHLPSSGILLGLLIVAGQVTVNIPSEKEVTKRVIGPSPEYPATSPNQLYAVLS